MSTIQTLQLLDDVNGCRFRASSMLKNRTGLRGRWREKSLLSFLLPCDCEPEAQFSRFLFMASTAQQVRLEAQTASWEGDDLHTMLTTNLMPSDAPQLQMSLYSRERTEKKHFISLLHTNCVFLYSF